ncbi:MAG TPA: ATP-binding protein [Stellaceae bacterium]|nr:ATP-binding protein [Stellaceae bacterium]
MLLVGTVLLPIVLGATSAYVSWRNSYRQAERSLSQAVATAQENTTKILDTHRLVAARIVDLLAPLSDDQIRAQEQALHDRMAAQIADLPEVAAAWAIDANGRELVSARVFPVNRSLDQSARDDFRAIRNGDAHSFIWALRARSLAGGEDQPYFTVSRRRETPDGRFGGIVIVAVSGGYFASFYDSLLPSTTDYTASVVRDDGSVLARYPAASGPAAPAKAEPALAAALGAGEHSGIIAGKPRPDAAGRIVAFSRVGDYPVYVTIERSEASIVGDWLRSVVGYALIGVPAAIALMVLSALALRRTRREQEALAQARDAIERRADMEARLHQAQKLEAVGLLTAGIAHDFSNLLTVIAGNIALLQPALDEADAKPRGHLAKAIEGCDRASELTKLLLGYAREDPVDPRPVNVNEIVLNALDLPWQTRENIKRELRLGNGLWQVCVDPNQLGTALLNLAFNARDAMGDEGGTLSVETANCRLVEPAAAKAEGVPPGHYVGIFVSDTGSGMPDEVRRKALDPFFTTKDPGKGTGLGLSQVQGFITRCGGACKIASEPGRGTTVKLYLPRHIPGVAADRTTASASREPGIADLTGGDATPESDAPPAVPPGGRPIARLAKSPPAA